MSDQPSILFQDRHSLLQVEQEHTPFLQRIFRVYRSEVRLLLWVTAIQLVMGSSSILINNFAQTAFLKRYGVESLPTIFLLEAIITFFFASAVGFLMNKHGTVRVFTGLYLFFALSMVLIRGLLPLGKPIVYPILYILKSQAVEILPILYWDILSDLFTTQQSKRLYTLITAGGILGTTSGSLLTGPVAHWVGIDNVLLVFVAGMLVSALMNEFTEKVAGTTIETRTDRRKSRNHGKFKENLQKIISDARRYPLLKYMIVIIAIPNILLPIMTYQFNVAVDAYYATEKDTLHFFGIFRGISNGVMFGILLFSGRMVARWGVPTSLLPHPINYLIAFGALFFRFDLISAVYARFSTETLKTTLNNPARTILFNFFPEQTRTMLRVFLRGNVVRASDFVGSGSLMLIKGLMDPRMLSLVAAPLVFVWLYTSMKIKKKYSSILIKSLKEKQINLNRMEDLDVQAWAKDRNALEGLRHGLSFEAPDIAVACGEILAKMGAPDWPKSIVEALPGKPTWAQRALLNLLIGADAPQTVPGLLSMARAASQESLGHLLAALSRLDPQASAPLMREFVGHSDPSVRVEALVGLYRNNDQEDASLFREKIEAMLRGDAEEYRMAVEVLGRTGDSAFKEILLSGTGSEDPHLKAWALRGLGIMKHDAAFEIASKAVSDAAPQVRKAALEVLRSLNERTSLDLWVRLLGDQDPEIREIAAASIRQQHHGVVQILLPALASPSKILRSEALSILEELGAPSIEVSQLITGELRKVYRYLAYISVLRRATSGGSLPFLIDHLRERSDEILEFVLRVLGLTQFREHLRIIIKALHSGNKRDMDNAIEALENSLHPNIRGILIPLLQETPLDEKLALGRRKLGIDFSGTQTEEAIVALLDDEDRVMQALALYALGGSLTKRAPLHKIMVYLDASDRLVQEAALWAYRMVSGEELPQVQPTTSIGLIERISFIREVPIFTDLRVRELVAIAEIATTKACGRDEVVVREGDPGDALYLVMDGQLAIIKGLATEQEVFLECIRKGNFFGEMALVDGNPRSASVKAEPESSLLVIGAKDFETVVLDYPSISFNICKFFAQRIRSLHQRISPFSPM